jgi:purine-binding chemotaxis protein CheW
MGVTIGGALFGLLLDHVQEVIAGRALSRLFHAPPLLCGVMSLRGEVLPVLEPALLLDVEPTAALEDAKIVVVREIGGLGRRAGLRVDALAGLRELPEGGLAPVPSLISERVASLLLGVITVAPACAVVNVSALLDVPELLTLRGESPPLAAGP